MQKYLKNISAVVFLALFLPYTITLLANGRQGISREEEMSVREYWTLCRMMQEDYSWMEDGTLRLMAILYRTEYVRSGEKEAKEAAAFGNLCSEAYDRVYRAVEDTKGQVITIDGGYRELPYHAVSAGRTRDGRLLGDGYSYVLPAECPRDVESDVYLQVCSLTKEEFQTALGTESSLEQMSFERDDSGYVIRASDGENEWQGEALRTLLHLASSCFWTESADGGLKLTVKGRGHGFGISLYTADLMIQDGARINEIIQKFYRNAECITIP